MELISSGPDVVRSASQHVLLSYWNRQRGTAELPAWRELENTEELAPLIDNLSYADVIEPDSAPRFLVRFQGTALIEALGEPGAGKFLDEILPSPYKEGALATATKW